MMRHAIAGGLLALVVALVPCASAQAPECTIGVQAGGDQMRVVVRAGVGYVDVELRTDHGAYRDPIVMSGPVWVWDVERADYATFWSDVLTNPVQRCAWGAVEYQLVLPLVMR